MTGCKDGTSNEGSEMVSMGDRRRADGDGLGRRLGRGVGRRCEAGEGGSTCMGMGEGRGVDGWSCCAGARAGELGGEVRGVLCTTALSRERRWSRLEGWMRVEADVSEWSSWALPGKNMDESMMSSSQPELQTLASQSCGCGDWGCQIGGG